MTFTLFFVAIQAATVVGIAAVAWLVHRLCLRADTLARRLRPLDAVADRLAELASPGQHAAEPTVPTTPPDGVHARRRYAPGDVAAASRAMGVHVDVEPASPRWPVHHARTSVAPADEHGRRPSSVRSGVSG